MRRPDDITSSLRAVAQRLHLAPRAEEREAAAVLGREHELVGVLARRRALPAQMLVTTIPLVLATVGLALDATSAPLVLGAAIFVQLWLVVAVPYLRRRMRDIVEELIANGNGAARRLRVVEGEYRRLATRAERERLARTLERFVDDAVRWSRLGPRRRTPPLGVNCLRFTVTEARDIVALLREGCADVRGVALTSRLLTDGTSPLFGTDAAELRQELRRIRFLLAVPRAAHDELLAA